MLKLEAATGIAADQAAAVDIRIDQVDTEIRASVDTALHDRRRMHIHYYVPGRDETTERDIDPMRLLFSEGQGYLEAWCHRANETRIFRLDRITEATLLDVPAEPPADARRTDLSQGLFQPDPEDPVAMLDLHPDASWVADYYPIESSEELADSRLRITLRYSDQGWLERLVLRLGGSGTLVEPAEVAEAVRARAAAALALYS
jgi:proteasome accessory factor C